MQEDPINLMMVIIGSFEDFRCPYTDLEILCKNLCRKISYDYSYETFNDTVQQLCYEYKTKCASDEGDVITLFGIGQAEAIARRCFWPNLCRIVDELKEIYKEYFGDSISDTF